MFELSAPRSDPPEAPAPSTDGRLVYAVGDVHGRLDLLEPLIGRIAADALETRPPARPLLILLGDYVDRGPYSAEVLDFILGLEAREAFELHALKGNHEEALLKFLEEPCFGALWARFGGGETLASYGVAAPPQGAPTEAWREARDAFAEALPERHLDLLRRLQLMVEVGGYLFVHAGVLPGRPLDRQAEHDLLWIREEFLDCARPLGRIVVHGHTPIEAPEVAHHRIGIDTGAYATNVLTGLRLFGAERAFLQARALGRDAPPPLGPERR